MATGLKAMQESRDCQISQGLRVTFTGVYISPASIYLAAVIVTVMHERSPLRHCVLITAVFSKQQFGLSAFVALLIK